MTNAEMKKLINHTATKMRAEHKKYSPKDSVLIEVNTRLPFVALNIPNGTEYFFQDESADIIINEANNAAMKFNTSIENTLLWMSTSW